MFLLDKMALSQGVENRRQAKAAERAHYLKMLLDFLEKFRLWIVISGGGLIMALASLVLQLLN